MKKIVSIFAAAVLAAGFMGCSNDSDDNSALMLALTSQSSGGSSLPASVGENNLSGNTYTLSNTEYKFEANSYTITTTDDYAETQGINTEYKLQTVTTVSYSYDSQEGIIFTNNSSEKTYVVRGLEKTPYELGSFSTDAEFIQARMEYIKLTNDLMSDADLEAAAKALRFSTFGIFYGYTDSTNATEVSKESIKMYNEIQASIKSANKRASLFVSPYAYEVNSTSLKLSVSNVYPAFTTLSDLCSKKYTFTTFYEGSHTFSINDTSSVINESCGTIGTDDILGLIITGVSSGNINLKQYNTSTLNLEVADPWSYTENLENAGLKVTLSQNSVEKGNFVIPYKTSSTSYKTFTKQ